MTLKFNLDPTPRKAAIIALLLFLEALLIPLQIHLQTTSELPTPVQFLTWATIGFIQLVTYLLVFFGHETEEKA